MPPPASQDDGYGATEYDDLIDPAYCGQATTGSGVVYPYQLAGTAGAQFTEDMDANNGQSSEGSGYGDGESGGDRRSDGSGPVRPPANHGMGYGSVLDYDGDGLYPPPDVPATGVPYPPP